MNIQRLRNLTTGLAHTKSLLHVQEDLETLTGVSFVTHQLVNALPAVKAVLRRRDLPKRFWNEKYDPEHTGGIDIEPFNEAEMKLFRDVYLAGKDPLEGKKVIVIRK